MSGQAAGAALSTGTHEAVRNPHPAGHSVRVGIALGGRVVEERIIPPGQPVTVGSDPDCTVVVGAGPRRFTLLEPRRDAEVLHFTHRMRGKVASGGGISSLEGLVADGAARQGRRRSTLPLDFEDKGKIKVGDTTVLFQFVPTPPTPAKVASSAGFRVWHWSAIDWIFMAVLGLSALAHTAMMVWVESQPPATVAQVQELQEHFVRLYIPEKPPVEVAEPAVGDPAKQVPGDAGSPKSSEPEPAEVAAKNPTPARPVIQLSTDPALREQQLRDQVSGVGLLALIPTAGDGTGNGVYDFLVDGGLRKDVTEALVLSGGGAPGRTEAPMGLRTGGDNGLVGSGELDDPSFVPKPGGRPTKDPVAPKPSFDGGRDWEPSTDSPTGYDVRSQVKRYTGRMRACYERELKSDPDLAGKLVLSWTIDEDGRLSGVSVDSDSIGSEALASCVVRRMGQAKFAAPDGEVEVASYPFVFSRQ